MAMQHLAAAAALRLRPQLAATLCGYIDGYRAGAVWSVSITDSRSYQILSRSLEEQLCAAELARLKLDGAALDFDSAYELIQVSNGA